MKISAYRIETIKGLIKDLDELDELIRLHRQHSEDDFMVSQYEAKKYERFQQLVRALMHHSLNKGEFSTYPLLQKLTERFYPDAKSGSNQQEILKKLEVIVKEAAAWALNPLAKKFERFFVGNSFAFIVAFGDGFLQFHNKIRWEFGSQWVVGL